MAYNAQLSDAFYKPSLIIEKVTLREREECKENISSPYFWL